VLLGILLVLFKKTTKKQNSSFFRIATQITRKRLLLRHRVLDNHHTLFGTRVRTERVQTERSRSTTTQNKSGPVKEHVSNDCVSYILFSNID
jgi:hypothetical protein